VSIAIQKGQWLSKRVRDSITRFYNMNKKIKTIMHLKYHAVEHVTFTSRYIQFYLCMYILSIKEKILKYRVYIFKIE
jgi:hypothetical protein